MAKRKNRPSSGFAERQKELHFFNLLRQGTQALHEGQIGKAIRLLEQSHRLDADNPDAALNLGGAYILAKKFTRAVSVLEPLTSRQPDNPMVWTNLGAAYLGNPVLAKDEEQQRAIAAFKQALHLNPKAPNVAYNLGLIYRDRRETAEAIRWFKQALKANPNDKDAKHYIEQLTRQNDNQEPA